MNPVSPLEFDRGGGCESGILRNKRPKQTSASRAEKDNIESGEGAGSDGRQNHLPTEVGGGVTAACNKLNCFTPVMTSQRLTIVIKLGAATSDIMHL